MNALCRRRILLLVVMIFTGQPVGSTWWYFSQFDQLSLSDHRMFCEIIPHLNKRQKKICNKNSDLVEIVGKGIKEYGISECQFQFRYQKWNCSTFVNDSSLFGKLLVRGGTREIAFLQAMHSASAIYKLARTCSRGHVKCGCSSETPNGRPTGYDGQFKWDGCDHVVKFSTNFVRRFVDATEMGASDGKAKFTLHNNRVGRIIIQKKMNQICKCHGLSGSCSMKTCWSTLPSFREVGDSLRAKYDSAVEITFKPSGRITPLDQSHKRPTKHNLIYYESSPDYCRINYAQGSVGTQSRICIGTGEGEESCEILCCKQKYETVKVHYSHFCNCTFKYCCQVNCQICNNTRLQHRCKY